MIKKIQLPLDKEKAKTLKAGDNVLLTGQIYVARDAAHERMTEAINSGEKPPFDIMNSVIFYAGPAPTRPGEVIGVIGPTTSGRMDSFTPMLLNLGLRGMIGKGKRDTEVIEAMKKNCAVYFGATGGTAVVISESVKASKVIAYPDLGPEAILSLQVENMPVVVLIDSEGNDLYEIGRQKAVEYISAHVCK